MFDKNKWTKERRHQNWEQYLEYQRQYRKRVANKVVHKYEKTPNGFLMRLYRNMKSRVTGVQKLKYHLYKDKELLDKQTFYEWSKSSKQFWKLYKVWVKSNFDRKLTPSVDRINPQKGYEIGNMEWVTHGENSRRSHKMKT